MKSIFNFDICENCTSCGACAFSCPVKAIEMKKNDDGNIRPVLARSCISCGKCFDICQIFNNKSKNVTYEKLFVYNNLNAINSASGGFVYDLAKTFLSNGYIVYANYFNKSLSSVHERITDNVTLEKIKSSRYVKSSIFNIFSLIEQDLKANRKVFIIGLPCELLAIKNVFKQGHIVYCALCCGGSIPQAYFDCYKNYLSRKFKESIYSINFRCKDYLPVPYCTKVEFENGTNKILNKYDGSFPNFLGTEFTMPSCYKCNKIETHEFDFVVGDSHIKNHHGTLVACSEKYMDLIEQKYIFKIESGLADIKKYFVYKKIMPFTYNNDKLVSFYKSLIKNYKKTVKFYIIQNLSFKGKISFSLPYSIKRKYLKIKER